MRFIVVALFICLAPLVACSPVVKPAKSDTHYMLGISYLRADDPTMALKEFLQAERISPDDADLQAALGQAYMLKKAFVESERHYQRALQLDPGNPHFQNNIAALYLEMKRYDDAIVYFRMAASNLLFPRPEVSWTGLGYAELIKENYPAALVAFEKAIDANWRFPAAYVRRGETYFALGKIDKAIIEYGQALRHAPSSILAHYDLAVAYLKQRKTDLAVSHFESVISLAPDSELAHQSRTFLAVLK